MADSDGSRGNDVNQVVTTPAGANNLSCDNVKICRYRANVLPHAKEAQQHCKLILLELLHFNGIFLRVISTIRLYLILCIVKQYKRHVSQVVGNGSHIKTLATHRFKSTQYSIKRSKTSYLHILEIYK